MQNSSEISSWLKVVRADGVGPVTFKKLIAHFGSVERVLGASVGGLCAVDGVGQKTAERIVRSIDKFDPSEELELAEKLGVWLIHLEDERYPVLLKQIYDPPVVLYVKGSLEKSDNLGISIVGSRRCSLYGQEQASRFAHLLGSAGFTIVSGLARGIDTASHRGALSSGGRTIAVQGCGLGRVFPPENEKLFEMVSRSGACVSELPLMYEPLAENFPVRNRIIAGLSLGTIVIEAAQRSGALITASAALSYGREVMAVPGKIDSPLSKGAHELIKEGAVLVDSVEDIMEALGYIGEGIKDTVSRSAKGAEEKMKRREISDIDLDLSENERAVLECLSFEAEHLEHIISQTELPVGSINASLISLRLKGLIEQFPGSMFKRR